MPFDCYSDLLIVPVVNLVEYSSAGYHSIYDRKFFSIKLQVSEKSVSQMI